MSGHIRTPDQRLRVFISSTIGELAAERQAAREAIQGLKLTPVYFESGARPHPAQELYRAYLEQSEVFVGIYASSYGWIAPGEQLSGVEDEYRLAAGKPQLVYVKNVPSRDNRLSTLLSDIQKHGAVCYQKFNTAEELSELIQNDLALLLAEQFDRATSSTATKTLRVSTPPLPVLRGKSVGRDKELTQLKSWLQDADCSLITLSGPGGTGKSRLALQLAHDLNASFADGAAFVSLAAVNDHTVVASSIARSLGLFDNGQRPVRDFLAEYLSDKQMLLVLDNFEQVLPAATMISELLDGCPRLRILATSRAPLHLSRERIFPVAPLDATCDAENGTREEILQCPAVQLFVMRARDADPSVDLSDQNIRAVATLCNKLDGLPLAIELAASRVRYLPPVAIKARIDKMLDLLSGGARDLPERQRTMRATIAWSYDLLDEESRRLFRRLSIFRDRWTLDGAEAVAADTKSDVLATVEKLVDLGLVRRLPWTPDQDEPRFTLLKVVRSYAEEQSEKLAESALGADAHAAHFVKLAARLEHERQADDSGPFLGRLEEAFPDIRAAFWHSIATNRFEDALDIIGSMRGLWFYDGMVSEARTWLAAAKMDDVRLQETMPPEIPGRALLSAGLVGFVSGQYQDACVNLKRSLELFRKANDKSDLARVLAYLGVGLLSMGEHSSVELLRESERLALEANDHYTICVARSFLSEAYLLSGHVAEAMTTIDRAIEVAERHNVGSAHAHALLQKGNLLTMQRRAVEAEPVFEHAIRIFDAVRMRAVRGWAHWGMAYVQFLLGNIAESRKQFLASLELGRSTSDEAMVASSLMGMALFTQATGRSSDAAALLSAAQETAQAINYTFWSTDRLLHEDLENRLRETLAPDELEAAFVRGKSLSRESALKLGAAAVDALHKKG